MKKWMAIPALAGAVVIGGVAMVANADKSDNQSTGVLAVEAAGNEDKAKLTVEEVEAKAIETVDGTVTEIDFDSSDNEYEVEVESGSVTYELDINATSGEVIKKERDDMKLAVVKSDKKAAPKATQKATTKNKNYITAKEAIAIALKHSPGTVKEVELDDDDKRAHFEIEIEDGKYEYEYEIDAITGEILDFEKDRDDD
ncbi:PepSY domain-containing protein [Sporosarcina sp. Marseille-Q4063]|uniref:PepSY domain-containing protein n=1 Tax=Sporosarcina sp. Marseille-Q4063 TaxID=2810514 RepID=UPI001BB04651|nr:PepSY domain-containing protein [Sporosarcina sp. Marseille-Q4063]QUW21000.1 PepSY domain-containing protein [Sporosarcina sp. Marseille-Q4063]